MAYRGAVLLFEFGALFAANSAHAQGLNDSLSRLDASLVQLRSQLNTTTSLPMQQKMEFRDRILRIRNCGVRIRQSIFPRLVAEEEGAMSASLDADEALVLEVSRMLPLDLVEAAAILNDVENDIVEKCKIIQSSSLGATPSINIKRTVKVTTVDGTAQPVSGFAIVASRPNLPGERYAESFATVTNPSTESRLLPGVWVFTASRNGRNFAWKATVPRDQIAVFDVSVTVEP